MMLALLDRISESEFIFDNINSECVLQYNLFFPVKLISFFSCQRLYSKG